MPDNTKLTDDDIARFVQNAEQSDREKPKVSRRIMVIGAGDGGCNIAHATKSAIPSAYTIAYNTSKRAMDNLDVDAKVIPNAEDGSGKDRNYSKNVFRRAAYKSLLSVVQKALADNPFDYIFVATTTDGGTGGGASPNIAKVVSDNVDIPVIIIGIYPSMAEDAKAQYNTIAWQSDVEKTGLPYMIFDNNTFSSLPKLRMHTCVNAEVVQALTLITGAMYGDSNISAIDNRDMHMILVEAGNRITVATTSSKPRVGQDFDDFLNDMMHHCAQPMPLHPTALGLFIKGPKSLILTTDTNMIKFRQVIGETVVYMHLEESADVQISLIISGSDVPEERIGMIKDRYNELTAPVAASSVTAASILADMDDPFAPKKSARKVADEADFTGLDL